MGVSENSGYLISGALIKRTLLFGVLYRVPLFSETPKSCILYPHDYVLSGQSLDFRSTWTLRAV